MRLHLRTCADSLRRRPFASLLFLRARRHISCCMRYRMLTAAEEHRASIVQGLHLLLNALLGLSPCLCLPLSLCPCPSFPVSVRLCFWCVLSLSPLSPPPGTVQCTHVLSVPSACFATFTASLSLWLPSSFLDLYLLPSHLLSSLLPPSALPPRPPKTLSPATVDTSTPPPPSSEIIRTRWL